MSERSDTSKNKRARGDDADDNTIVDDTNPPLTLPLIKARIKQLVARIPSKDETAALTVEDLPAMENWCRTVRKILRQYTLCLNFVPIANYQW